MTAALNFTLRDAARSDLPRIVEIYNASIPARLATGDLVPVSVEQREPWFNVHGPEKYPLIVADTPDNKLIGWGSLSPFYGRAAYRYTAEISIYIASETARQGVASRIADELMLRAPKLGLKTLLAFIFAHNEPSVRFFSKRGYKLWGHLPRIADLDAVERDLDIYGFRFGP
jgi:L-amino acid N-acyltransferase YncA